MRWIKFAALYLFVVVFFYLIQVYIANFSTRQSIVLALLWASLLRANELHARRPVRRFSPYYVRVDPNWYDLLIDFKLVDETDEWHALQTSLNELPPTEYRVLRSGIRFTVVHQSDDFERELIFLNDHQAFVSEVDLREDIEPLRIESTDRFGNPNKCDVHVFVKFGGDGYKLGIRGPCWWWNEVKASCPKPMEEIVDHPTGQVDLILAVISYREFDLYWEPVVWNTISYDKTTNLIKSRRDEQRDKLGWKTIEYDSDLGAELGINWPESIKHKYFNVEHRAI